MQNENGGAHLKPGSGRWHVQAPYPPVLPVFDRITLGDFREFPLQWVFASPPTLELPQIPAVPLGHQPSHKSLDLISPA